MWLIHPQHTCVETDSRLKPGLFTCCGLDSLHSHYHKHFFVQIISNQALNGINLNSVLDMIYLPACRVHYSSWDI